MTIYQGALNSTATSALGTNFFADQWFEESKFLRRVKRIAIHAGETLGNYQFELGYGDKVVAHLYATGAGDAVIANEDLVSIDSKMVCLPGEEMYLRLVGSNAIATHAGLFHVEIEEIPMPRRRGGSRFRRGRRGFRRFGRRRRY